MQLIALPSSMDHFHVQLSVDIACFCGASPKHIVFVWFCHHIDMDCVNDKYVYVYILCSTNRWWNFQCSARTHTTSFSWNSIISWNIYKVFLHLHAYAQVCRRRQWFCFLDFNFSFNFLRLIYSSISDVTLFPHPYKCLCSAHVSYRNIIARPTQ